MLILAQAAHSTEEYVFRLFDVFAPARFVSSLMSEDLAVGFALVNAGLVLFGLWCYAARVRPDHSSGPVFAWLWTVLELGNGIGHTGVGAVTRWVLPGVATAPVLLAVSTYLAVTLSAASSRCGVEDARRHSRE
jgi:hypothetical protein